VQKTRISIVFDKLNYLIDDFAKTEQVISENYKPNKSPFSVGAILSSAVDMMMLDNVDEKILVENLTKKKLHVDLGLFALAIKNLLDNGLKYSTNGKVNVKEENDAIVISTIGNKLSRPLEEYFKPFHNDTTAKNHGMGLGLYIVHTIAKIHEMKLEYDYLDGINTFKIKYNKLLA
jgi:two-component system OmpR family sensor kinase